MPDEIGLSTFRLSSGHTVPLPCKFRKVKFLTLLYAVNTDAINTLLPKMDIRAALPFGKKTIVTIGIVQYLDSDLGAYDEYILAIPASSSSQPLSWNNWKYLLGSPYKRSLALYVHRIIVTTSLSALTGIEIWGFSKKVQPIVNHFEEHKFTSSVFSLEDKKICSFSGKFGFSIPVPALDMLTLSQKEGRFWKTGVTATGVSRLEFFPKVELDIFDKADNVGADLDILGIQKTHPVALMYNPEMMMTFDVGMPWSTG
jgi:hypothetical protein